MANSKSLKHPVLLALVYSLGLQIITLLVFNAPIGGTAGFILSAIGMLILVPKMLAYIAADGFRMSGDAIERLSWVMQFAVWFLIFYVLLSLPAPSKREN